MTELPWLPIDTAPSSGRVIEAKSLNWGRGPGTTLYRVRRLGEIWINADEPREELEHLVEWRLAAERRGIAQLFDDLPIASLAGHAQHGLLIEMLHTIVDRLRTHDPAGDDAVLQLARALPTPGYRFEKHRWYRCPKCGGEVVRFFGGELGADQACVGTSEDEEAEGCGWHDRDVLPEVRKLSVDASSSS